MMRRTFGVAAMVAALLAGQAPAADAAGGVRVRPLDRAHAHNDYEHDRPLLDALGHGFTSVEADIWLVDGQLLVAHDRADVRPDRTLQSLYLDPLARRVRANHGRVHRGSDRPFQLLIDLKNTGAATYTELDRVLRRHRAMLTTYADGRVRPGAVTAVVSGDRPRELMQSQRERYAFYDGRSADLGSAAPASFVPLISDNWNNLFTWQGVGPMPAAERARLREFVRVAHRNGQRVRFWATPDQPGPARDAVWRELVAADVDHLNTDDLAGLERFLRASARPTPAPVTFALIGDTPYGDAQRAVFPALVADINAAARVRFVLHAGDVKSGSTTCDDARFADLAALFDTFEDPFVLTPGDNEWTDCHRTAAGGFLPTERLAAVRRVFYPRPGWTTGGRPMPVLTQAADPRHRAYRENTMFVRSQVVFSTVHVVGSENGLDPWAQLPGGDRPAARLAEVADRTGAALAWIDATFAAARLGRAPGVLLMMQAEPTGTPAFAAIRDRITRHARAYGRPVLLVHGDEHVYEEEPGYAGVPNLTRLETFGDTAVNWLQVTADPGRPEVFRWQVEAVPVAG